MNSNNYYKINVTEVHQLQTGILLLGKLNFRQLRVLHRLTERKENLLDPFNEKTVNINNLEQEFQRQLSKNKLNKITSYLSENFNLIKEKKAFGVFPTSIIISLGLDDNYDDETINLDKIYTEGLQSCFIRKDEIDKDRSNLIIPKNERIALIVDGQHRFYGINNFYDSLKDKEDKELVDNFEFIVTFLLGFDIYDVGKIFATVNFTQKPVNRSLYYDIFGSAPEPDRNDIKLAHDLALHLNNNSKSPIKGMIKMLGKGYGLISQAFFVEKMLIHFRKSGVWEKIYADYLRGGKKYKELPNFMIAYLDSIKKSFPDAWPLRYRNKVGIRVYHPRKYEFILCKTTGLGAFFRLIRELYPKVEDFGEVEMKNELTRILSNLSPETNDLFSNKGVYGGAGSEGLQTKLYKLIKDKLAL